jgi:hypothetical protein
VTTLDKGLATLEAVVEVKNQFDVALVEASQVEPLLASGWGSAR